MIQAKIVAGSKNPFNDKKLVTFQIRLPRIILAELNTHRMLVSNASSSRAIPFSKKVEAVQNDPFVPIAWQKDHKGMQGTEYFTDTHMIKQNKLTWLSAAWNAVDVAKQLSTQYIGEDVVKVGVTKQLCNRLLEPFEYIDVVISGTEWWNFFDLRLPKYRLENSQGSVEYCRSRKDWLLSYSSEVYGMNIPKTDLDWLAINESQAEIHIQALSELMWDLYRSYDYKMLEPGEWHIPFYESIIDRWDQLEPEKEITPFNLFPKISTAICARGSYGKFEGKTVEDDIKLHDRLLSERHMSPFSHSAKCPTHDEYEKYSDTKYVGQDKPRELGWFSQFHGFMSYRYQLERNLI